MTSNFFAHTPPKDSKDSNKWHGLKEHLSKVAKLAEISANKLQAGKLGYYAGLWHDLGKYNPDFQEYLKQCHGDTVSGIKKKRRGPNHKTYGAILANELCPILAPIIQGHHGGLPDSATLEQDVDLEYLYNNNPEFANSYQSVVEIAKNDLGNLEPNQDLDELIEQIVPEEILSQEIFYRMLFSCLIDADHLDAEAHFEQDNSNARTRYKAQHKSIPELWNLFDTKRIEYLSKPTKTKNKNQEVQEIRDEIYQTCIDAALNQPGVFRLAVPTGGGKTLSGLAFALQHAALNKNNLQRVIVAVPYTSIIEQTVNVYRDILGIEQILEHHSAVKNDLVSSDPNVKQSQVQAKLATQNWDAPLIVTTTVQLFESLFSNRPGKCRKLHNLVGSVIILDEVQTLPIKLLQPIVKMLEELVERYHVSVVLCTATQPALEGIDKYFEGFKSIQDIIPVDRSRELFQQLKRVRYNTDSIYNQDKWSWEQLSNSLKSHNQVLAILNTRKDALKVLDSLEVKSSLYISIEQPEAAILDAIQRSQILHISTLLCGEHRRTVLAEVRRRLTAKEDCILVSTQVVEAGVDIDFPTVYRSIGPLDRIVQAAGRCNREGNELAENSQVIIFELAEGSTPGKGTEYKQATDETRSLLEADPNFTFDDPRIFENYFRSLYQTRDKTTEKKIADERELHNFKTVAKLFKLIDDKSTPVVIPYNQEVEDILREIERRGLWSSDFPKLQPYIVSIPEWELQQAKRNKQIKAVDDLFVLETGIYHPIRGIPFGQDPDDSCFLLAPNESVF